MPSKSRTSYDNKMLHYDADIELIDILCTAINSNELLPKENLLFAYADQDKHPVLCKRRNCIENREMAIYHLRQTIYSSYIKDMYEEFTMFLKSIVSEVIKNIKVNPDRLIGEHKINISAKELLSLGTVHAINDKIVETLFQTLEAEQSTVKLIKKVCDKLELTIDENLIDSALPYLEIRHKLVHADGKIDDTFKKKYPHIRCDSKNYIDLRYQFIVDARQSVKKLVLAIDEIALNKGFLKPHVENKKLSNK